MILTGLIGRNIQSSLSPFLHRKWMKKYKINGDYGLFSTKDSVYHNLRNILDEICGLPNLRGFNVTSPHKEEIIQYLDKVNPIAQEIGAVNTVLIDNNKMIGYNTDWLGFTEVIKQRKIKDTCIIGGGATSRSIKYALEKSAIKHRLIDISYDDDNHPEEAIIMLKYQAAYSFEIFHGVNPLKK